MEQISVALKIFLQNMWFTIQNIHIVYWYETRLDKPPNICAVKVIHDV